MNLQQIKYFLVLCEEQHFSRAARRCDISQPSLTNAIKALEHELGGCLFDRKPRIKVSKLGLMLRPHFKSAVKAIERTRAVAASANGHAHGSRDRRAGQTQERSARP